MPTLAENNRAARLLPNGIPRYVRIYDNGGETWDRYTVVFTGRYRHKTGGEFMYLGMSELPFHPQGFGQHGQHSTQIDCLNGAWPPAIGRKCHLGTRIKFTDLPQDCQRAVIYDYVGLWDISTGGEA